MISGIILHSKPWQVKHVLYIFIYVVMSLLLKVVRLVLQAVFCKLSEISALFLQDGEIDLKLLTKVLAPEQEVKEVSEFLVNIACELPL